MDNLSFSCRFNGLSKPGNNPKSDCSLNFEHKKLMFFSSHLLSVQNAFTVRFSVKSRAKRSSRAAPVVMFDEIFEPGSEMPYRNYKNNVALSIKPTFLRK